MELLEDQLAARVQLGAGAAAIGHLQELVSRYPLRENLWYWLMMALYRNGRQADALEAYTHVRKVLVDELGLEPGRDLQDLERQVLRGDLGAGDSSSPVQLSVSSTTPGNLPRMPSPLIGRERDLEVLQQHLRDQRLVTLVGTPGVGKTRLAIEAARQSATDAGTWLIRLDAVDETSSLSQMVAETLKLSGEQALFERLNGAETLLIFDNCEHVIDDAADLINRLLDATGELRVLATSQLPLAVDGELVYEVMPLPVAESVLLFTSRATQIRPQLLIDPGAA